MTAARILVKMEVVVSMELTVINASVLLDIQVLIVKQVSVLIKTRFKYYDEWVASLLLQSLTVFRHIL